MQKKLRLFFLSPLLALISSTAVLSKSFAPNQALQTIANQPQTSVAQANSTTPPQSAMTGWLGFATTANKNGTFLPLLPVNADAQVALFSDVWDQVKPGTSLVGIAGGIKQQVKFRRSKEEPFGCEQNKTKMATFTAPKRFPFGPVWLLPANIAKEAKSLTLQALNLSEVPTSVLPVNKRKPSQARAWKAGGATIVMQKQTKDQVRLSILINSRIAYNAVEKQFYIQGDDPEPVKFPNFDGTPGIPFPIGAFQANAKSAPMIVFWQPSYEGQGYSVVASVKGKMQKVDEQAIYFCAF
ncbi:hypothetical protein H6G76_34860 [Nostoc sp. FACHB-152]|uniref:hypothetical protein n=1 Tax=unclassified Nostoc TaxID=2593658 RepID=UPI001683C5DF|nr:MULTISPECIES: hypothetical protein [unclassified Nostoc]MBD2452195.1 hypothetical protein [Nostoc sp. FACHB-152]MBD2473228.1 hypothetical protein [Nostoc sp. FACHB-145]